MKWIMQRSLPALSLAVAVVCPVAGSLCPQLCLSPPAARAVKCPRVVTKRRGRRFDNLLGEKKGRESELGKKLRSVCGSPLPGRFSCSAVLPKTAQHPLSSCPMGRFWALVALQQCGVGKAVSEV